MVVKIAGFKRLTRKINSFVGHHVDRQGFPQIPPIIGLIGITVAVGAAGFASQTGLADTLIDLLSKL